MPTPARRHFNVTMPDGTVIADVPEGITQDELWTRYTLLQRDATPIDRAITAQDEASAAAQIQAQNEYTERQRQIAEFERQHPEGRYGPDIMREPAAAIDPHLQYRAPALPPPPQQQFAAQYKLGNLEDPETKRRVLAQTLFPNDPNGINRVGFMDGEPVYVDDKGQLQKLTSGTTRFTANLAANAPEMVLGGIGSAAGPGGAVLGAAGAHGLKRAVAGMVFNEPQTIGGNLASMGKEAALTIAGEGLGRGITAVGNRGKFIDLTPRQMRTAEQVREHVLKTTGIDLNLAAASGDRKLQALYAYAARYPGKSADLIQAAEEANAAQYQRATDRVLDSVATGTPAEIAGANGMNAAELALSTARRIASNKVRPLYNAAYEKNPKITDPELLAFLKLPYFEEAYKRGQVIARLEEKGAPTTVVSSTKSTRQKHPSGAFHITKTEVTEAPITTPDLRSLDYLKQGLDDVIANLEKDGRITKLSGALRQQKKAFIEALDRLPSGEYQLARAKYADLYRNTVEPLENGPVGILAKIKDPDAAGAAAKVFSDPDLTPTQISLARKAIEAQNPTAWNELVRTWLAENYNRALRESQTGVELNTAGKFRQSVYGTPKARAKAAAMLPAGSTQLFNDLMDASQKLSSTPIAGSNTMRDTDIKEVLKGSGAAAFKWFTTPRQRAIDLAERRALEKGTVAIAEALLDPAKRTHLRRVLRMRPSTQQAILLSTIIGAQTAQSGVEAAFPSDEDSGPFAQ